MAARWPPLPPVVWSRRRAARTSRSAEIWVGVRDPGHRGAGAGHAILRDALDRGGRRVVPAPPHDDDVLAPVHDPALLDHLRTVAWDEWGRRATGGSGQDRVVPYVFPTPGDARRPARARPPAAMHARAGLYCYDTMTLVGPGTWAAARAAVDVALTAVDLVARRRAARRTRWCRPPGPPRDPARRSAARATSTTRRSRPQALRGAGRARVAVVDVDAHHGNGTQAMFYDRADVFYGSVHVDPGAGWFPHFVGLRGRSGGTAPAPGPTRNRPLAPGTGDDGWLAARPTARAARGASGAGALVVRSAWTPRPTTRRARWR